MVMTQQPQAIIEPPKPSDLDLLRAFLRDELRTVIQELKPRAPVLKGEPVRLFVNQASTATSDQSVDCRGFNALHVEVFAFGTPSATLVVQGRGESGALAIALPSPNATQTITGSTSFEVTVGSAWASMELTITSGSFTVIATPYWSPGPGSMGIANVGACKLTKGDTVAEEVTLTNANTNYVATTAMPAFAKYVVVYCTYACIVAMGEATSSTVGVYVGAGQPTVFPVTRTGIAADDKPHAQSATAGAVVRFTWMAD